MNFNKNEYKQSGQLEYVTGSGKLLCSSDYSTVKVLKIVITGEKENYFEVEKLSKIIQNLGSVSELNIDFKQVEFYEMEVELAKSLLQLNLFIQPILFKITILRLSGVFFYCSEFQDNSRQILRDRLNQIIKTLPKINKLSIQSPLNFITHDQLYSVIMKIGPQFGDILPHIKQNDQQSIIFLIDKLVPLFLENNQNFLEIKKKESDVFLSMKILPNNLKTYATIRFRYNTQNNQGKQNRISQFILKTIRLTGIEFSELVIEKNKFLQNEFSNLLKLEILECLIPIQYIPKIPFVFQNIDKLLELTFDMTLIPFQDEDFELLCKALSNNLVLQQLELIFFGNEFTPISSTCITSLGELLKKKIQLISLSLHFKSSVKFSDSLIIREELSKMQLLRRLCILFTTNSIEKSEFVISANQSEKNIFEISYYSLETGSEFIKSEELIVLLKYRFLSLQNPKTLKGIYFFEENLSCKSLHLIKEIQDELQKVGKFRLQFLEVIENISNNWFEQEVLKIIKQNSSTLKKLYLENRNSLRLLQETSTFFPNLQIISLSANFSAKENVSGILQNCPLLQEFKINSLFCEAEQLNLLVLRQLPYFMSLQAPQLKTTNQQVMEFINSKRENILQIISFEKQIFQFLKYSPMHSFWDLYLD